MAGFVKNVLQYVQKGQSSQPDKLALRPISTAGDQVRIVRKQLSLNFRWHARVAAIAITDVDIYYGSLTGTAERYAMRLGNDMAARGLNTVVRNLDAFDPREFTRKDRMTSTRAFIFVISTHFAGSAPPTAELFYEWLQFPSENTSSTTFFNDPDAKIAGPSDEHIHSSIQSLSSKQSKRASSSRAASILSGMQYTVFGIRDSTYLTYNAFGKFVDIKLLLAGATRLLNLKLADISEDIEAVFVEWNQCLITLMPAINSVRPADVSIGNQLLGKEDRVVESPPQTKGPAIRLHANAQHFPRIRSHSDTTFVHNTQKLSMLPENLILDVNGAPVRLRFRCRFIDDPDPRRMPAECAAGSTLCTKSPGQRPGAMIKLIERHLCASTPTNEIVCVKLTLMNPELRYDAADIFAYFPPNPEEQVHQIASHFGFELDSWFELDYEGDNTAQQLPFPTPCTVRTALTGFLEMRTVSREFVRVASRFVSVECERDLLENLSSIDGSATFYTQFVEQHKCIADLIAIAPSLKLPFEVFVCIAPPIKPRLYSITSSPLICPRTIDIAMSLGPQVECSTGKSASYLKHLMQSEHNGRETFLRAFIISTPFKLPKDASAPIIMIANGIGVGLMRALLQQREHEWKLLQPEILPDKKSLTNLVFLGCTNLSSLLFKDEFDLWEQNGFIWQYVACTGELGHESNMVQQLVGNHVQTIFKIMNQSIQARIYVCGGLRMTKTIRVIMQGHSDPNWFTSIVSNGRYIEDAVCFLS